MAATAQAGKVLLQSGTGILEVRRHACCPYLTPTGCSIAEALRMCSNGDGFCTVILERCCGWVRDTPWFETCSFYQRASDCRFCEHYDKARNMCRKRGKQIRYFTGLCSDYKGPRPVSSLVNKVNA